MAERPGVLLYFDILPALDKLPHEAVGELLIKALHYAQDGVEPVFDDSALVFAWAFLKPAIDRDGVVYRDKRLRGDWLTYCRQCKRDGIEPLDFETWRERADNGTLQPVDVPLPTTTTSPSPTHNQYHGDSAAQPPSALYFTPPTVEEVAVYVRERGSAVDPQGFLDYYAARGWKIGNTPMQDWKAACRNAESWERWKKTSRSVQTVQANPESYQQDMARLRRILEADERREDGGS